jgi:hypothetical protein
MKVYRRCRVCGKEYEACNTPNTTGAFRWQDVACSKDCGAIYLQRILKSREYASQGANSNIADVKGGDCSD